MDPSAPYVYSLLQGFFVSFFVCSLNGLRRVVGYCAGKCFILQVLNLRNLRYGPSFQDFRKKMKTVVEKQQQSILRRTPRVLGLGAGLPQGLGSWLITTRGLAGGRGEKYPTPGLWAARETW